MKIVSYGEKFKEPVAVCLGRYESLHLGHSEIVKRAAETAKKQGAQVMLMTYDDGDTSRFGRVILDFEERLRRAEALGVSSILKVDFSESFKAVQAEEFLANIFSALDIRGVSCGFDFRFGKGRAGDAEYLKKYCDSKNIPLNVCPEIEWRGDKISTSRVKKALSRGDVISANAMLGYYFSVGGKVEEGRHVGRGLGFPTANIAWPEGKWQIARGVYAAHSRIDGRVYPAIANFGTAPTFGVEKDVLEVHFKGYDGDLYGRELTVAFDKFIRGIVKFPSAEALRARLAEDMRELENL